MTSPKISFTPLNPEPNASPASEVGICIGGPSGEIPWKKDGESSFSGPLPKVEGSSRHKGGVFVTSSVAVTDHDSVLGAYEEFLDHWLSEGTPWYEKALETPLVVFGGIGNGVLALGGSLAGCSKVESPAGPPPPPVKTAEAVVSGSLPGTAPIAMPEQIPPPVPLDLSVFEEIRQRKKQAQKDLSPEQLEQKFAEEAADPKTWDYLKMGEQRYLTLKKYLSKGERKFDLYLSRHLVSGNAAEVLLDRYKGANKETEELIDLLLILKEAYPDIEIRASFGWAVSMEDDEMKDGRRIFKF